MYRLFAAIAVWMVWTPHMWATLRNALRWTC